MSDIDIKIKSSYEGSGSQAAIKDMEKLGTATKSSAGLEQVGARAQAAAKSIEGLSGAQIKAAKSAEDLATKQNRSAASAANVEAANTRAAKSALSLAQAQDKAAQSGARAAAYTAQFSGGVRDGITGLIGPIAVAGTALRGLEAIAGGLKDGLNIAATLDEQRRSVGILLGDVQKGNSVFQQAATFGQRYGFTQKEMGDAAAAAAPLIRSSTTSVEKQLEVLGRLASLNTKEGFSGATFSTKELASGDITSIVERFNIARSAANRMKQEIAGGADVFRVLDAELSRMGISVDVLANRMEGTAGAVRGAEIAVESLKVTAGNAIAPTVELAANGLERIIRAAAGSQQAIDEMRASLSGQDVAALQAADATRMYVDAVTVAGTGTGQTRDELQALGERMAAVASEGPAAKAGVDALVDGLYTGTTTSAELSGQLAQLANQQQFVAAAASEDAVMLAQAATATESHSGAAQVNAGALAEQTQKSLEAKVQAQDLARFQAELANLGGAVAGGMQTAGNAALALANQYGIAYGAALQLIQAQAALAQAAVNKAAFAEQRSGERNPGESGAAEAAAQEEARLQSIYRRLQDAPAKAAVARQGGASAAGAKLAAIEQKTGDKLTDIVSKTQDKLIAIDNKAAEARLAAAKRLNQALATNAVDRRAANEADDLDLIGPMDEKAAAKLNDRERAQASAREREKAAAAEAQAGIARGEAETAEKVYAAREEQIQARQQLDENYYARQRELADDPGAQAALTQQYDEAVRAADEAAQLRIQFAQAAAEEAAGAAAEEKARIIAEAEEQANQVIGASERSAAGVKKATASARDEAIASIRAIGDSINALPAEKRIKISVDGSGGVSTAAAGKSDGAYAGGGSFMTQGPTTITVGDNPGGAELVTVTPLSGSGQTRAAAGTIALAGGGSVLADAGDGYTTPVAGTGSSAKKGRGKGGAATAAAAKDQIAEQKAAIDLLSDLIKLRHDMAAELENGTPFDVAFAERLSNVAAEFARFVRAALPSATKAETEAFKLSADNTKQSIGILSEMVDLRKDLSDWQSVNPIDLAFVQRLAATAAEVTRLVMSQLVPTTELEVDRLERWAALEGAAVGLISDVTKLNQRMFSDYVPPSDAQLDMVVKDADRIADRMIAAAKKYDTKGLEAAKLYGDALGGFYSTAKDALLFNQAINSGDFDQNQANLDKFERSASVAIGVAKRLGAEAATIPSTDLAALQLTTQALAAQSEALIKLAAVPFGDLPGAAANLNAQAAQLLGGYKGGGGAVTNIYNTFQMPPGTPAQLVEMVIQRLGQQVNARK